MSFAVLNGTLVMATGLRRADIVCQDGMIATIGEPGADGGADDAVDASGCLIFPGFIDPHIHSRDPGLTEKEDFAHATRAAAAGGITTLFDMPNTLPPVADAQVLVERASAHAKVAHVDFGLWGLSLGQDNVDELESMVRAGAVGIKLFLGYWFHRGSRRLLYDIDGYRLDELMPPPSNGAVLQVFERVAAAGGLVAAHCEDRGVIDTRTASLGRRMETYEDLVLVRPDVAEAASVAAIVELARHAGCRLHVLHISSAAGLALVTRSRAAGIRVTGETCPHYLTLTTDTDSTLGARMKAFPPVRHVADRDALLAGVRDGAITSIGSDHAPHTAAEKQLPFAEAPAGLVATETLVPLMLDLMHRGVLSPQRLASVLSTETAKLYGVYPQKGAIEVGSDADFSIVEPEHQWTIRAGDLHSKQHWSPWDGRAVTGRARTTVLHGRVVANEGEPCGDPIGAFVRPRRDA